MSHWHWAISVIVPCQKSYGSLTLSLFSDLIVPREPLFLARELCLTDTEPFKWSHFSKGAIFPGKITMSHWHWDISVISLCQESHFSWQENYFSLTLSHFSDLTAPKELCLTDTEQFQWSYCVKNYVSLTLSLFSDLTAPKELCLTDTEPFQWSYCVKNYASLTLSHFSDLIVPTEPLFLARELCLTDTEPFQWSYRAKRANIAG